MTRTDIINHYLDNVIKQGSKCYLEIGVRNLTHNFNHIRADIKDGVDPDKRSNANYIMTSDEFFKDNTKKYDVIFVDGLHQHKQAYRDVVNSLGALRTGGIVIMHDCNPTSEYIQTEEPHKGAWTGTAWKAFVQLRCERSDLEMFVVDTDWGIGVIIPHREQVLFNCAEDIYDYNVFVKYRKEALNLLSPDEFKSLKGYSL